MNQVQLALKQNTHTVVSSRIACRQRLLHSLLLRTEHAGLPLNGNHLGHTQLTQTHAFLPAPARLQPQHVYLIVRGFRHHRHATLTAHRHSPAHVALFAAHTVPLNCEQLLVTALLFGARARADIERRRDRCAYLQLFKPGGHCSFWHRLITSHDRHCSEKLQRSRWQWIRTALRAGMRPCWSTTHYVCIGARCPRRDF